MFEKILVPLDGSEHSVRALEIAIRIAKKFEGKITLIHVYSVYIPFVIRTPPAEVSKVAEAARKAGAGILADGEEKVKAEGVQVETLLREGNTVQEILKTAREGGFDLIVMGARGISRIGEILLGSVSDGVIRNTPCPVLVTKKETPRRGRENLRRGREDHRKTVKMAAHTSKAGSGNF